MAIQTLVALPEILEYCDAKECLDREDYYFNKFKPNYNICPKAGSSFGRVTTEETKAKLSALALTRTYPHGKAILVEVKDVETNITTTYDSIRKAAIALNSDIKTILRREQNNITKSYRGRYIINIKRN